MAIESLVVLLVTGALAGWIAGVFSQNRSVGLYIMAGIFGAFFGGWLLPQLGLFGGSGILGTILCAVIGALTIFLILYFVRGSQNQVQAPEMAPASLPLSKPVQARRPWQKPEDKIFVSYRRDDSLDVTGRIYDRLLKEYSDKTVFRDMDSIPLGFDFRQHIDKLISECSVCVVVIGNRWLTVTDKTGQRRLDDPKDHVRIEIESALRRNVRVVPLLIGGAEMPSIDDLPPSLHDLAFRNGTHIRPDPDFHRDVDRLVAGLRSG
jgi:uncharacterized membrane protein YeaQ/YmgE (transglycosylase-associated protein family)